MAADAGPDIRSAYDRSRGRGAAIFCEPLVKNWLRERGIPVPEGGLVENSREALTLASRLSYPLVLKVVSDRVLHKTELGGVVLGIDSPAALGTAYEALEREARQAVEGYAGILLEEQAPTGTEIIVGLQNDPHFGPVLMVGTGGIYSDLLEDVAFRMLPVTRRDIEEMLGGLKGKPLLEGFRANPPADIEALVEVILGLARFGAEIAPYFASADFNPVIAFPQGALVVDAKVVLSEEVSSHPFGFEPPSTRYLEGFFAPESVAVVGASASEGKIGNVIVDSLINYDFKGRIYPINPNREEIMGVRCYPSLDALPESPQLVVMVIDLKEGPDLMRKLADLGVHNLLIVSGGGRELGGERQLIEEEMARLARELDIRVVGPNCIGSFDGKTRFDSFFHSHQRLLRPPSGPLSFITQSGTYGCAFLENAAVVGVAKMVSYGNRLDVDEGDLIAFLSQDPDTRVIGSYIEGLSRGRKYVAAAKEAVYGRKKPVVAFKTGQAHLYYSAALTLVLKVLTLPKDVLQSTAAITAAEANVLDGATAGTGVASKAVVLDANKDHSGMRNHTVTGDVTVSSDPTGGNAGARSQVIGLPRIKYVGLSTMVNGTTETTAYIDETPTGEWAEVDAGTNVAVTADTTYYRDVTNSLKVAFGATAVAGDGVDGTITVDDLSANESVGFWAYTDATTAVASGDFALTLDDTDGTDQTYVLPALTSGVWTWVELNIAACDANCNTTDGVKVLLTTQGALKYGVSTGEAVNLYLDAMYKWDADNEEALGVSIVQDGVLGILTLVDANTGTHGQASLTEYTDFFTHYETGADFIVTVSDQSTKSGTALIAY